MNVLLIYPEFPDTFWSFKHALQFIRKRASLPPLGLLTVAAMLPPAWGKRLVDMNVRNLTDADLKWAGIAFISAMAVQREIGPPGDCPLQECGSASRRRRAVVYRRLRVLHGRGSFCSE